MLYVGLAFSCYFVSLFVCFAAFFFCFFFQKLAAHLDKEREKMNEFRKMMGLPLEGDE